MHRVEDCADWQEAVRIQATIGGGGGQHCWIRNKRSGLIWSTNVDTAWLHTTSTDGLTSRKCFEKGRGTNHDCCRILKVSTNVGELDDQECGDSAGSQSAKTRAFCSVPKCQRAHYLEIDNSVTASGKNFGAQVIRVSQGTPDFETPLFTYTENCGSLYIPSCLTWTHLASVNIEPNAATLTLTGTGAAKKYKVSVLHVNKTAIDATAWQVIKQIDA